VSELVTNLLPPPAFVEVRKTLFGEEHGALEESRCGVGFVGKVRQVADN